MNIVVVGTGYVGLVTGTCLADLGHRVTCVDIDARKIDFLKRGTSPIYEEGLEALIQKNIHLGNLLFFTSLTSAVSDAEIIFIAVGTPSDVSGKADLQYVYAVANELGQCLDHNVIVVNKSTVPVGTAAEVGRMIAQNFSGACEVVSCPEFLREGTAVNDFFHPDRIVLGVRSRAAEDVMLKVFEAVQCPKVVTTVESAEMIKYASNAFLATKISFINEIANICERVGANVEEVAYGMGLDSRIGNKFLRAGIGYGGSCFPKDIRALNQIAGINGYDFKLLKGVIEVNNNQRLLAVEKLNRLTGGLRGKTIAMLGVAFKSNTDDVRESAAIDISELLLERGVRYLRTHDPAALMNAKKILDKRVALFEDPYAMVQGCDGMMLATEWEQFRHLDWQKIRSMMRTPVLVDGRNLLDPVRMQRLGFLYDSIGRTLTASPSSQFKTNRVVVREGNK
ncbi:MAG: hypothetical protein A3B74_00025 [Candidatus Kerfeldbacteria bacterium RIFCSPHIGHO2_02_FULL_42_14]|uniref:UDP-glucose 6-dehydrogenase n=1 Tax=Candidatus Kerfeldbacteria bacterium RIFCSPHIGHO2_02_FULL_42_14 TaxID=1798540 RepID=A0A1G2ART3_9BACT|nr:MAG: hypothetical protein A3B74_00025 [Candidatus Kerfeldbacteria bacterium RIFCSPHIGHO2_02_FULL_42_14]OGY81336.1 MAG: hypothetical protein A3E60_02715 [Candidatus Kerfeldbacteria bacterium RIFCSPHIGHO2_12_FULL_42_13]OGY83610.1 MAG: hypothetical protein A3I91_03145 [Candidatus Kerfeldbacteria bacterium RIFCSPLOWO2_02_FULL_42_19]OGY86676.1 MAG: hypothetical protein A3G01_00480 [Candidatus Kerfeldbacteria bacterium RIFCSPLOWO2_12_FULL_43_9]